MYARGVVYRLPILLYYRYSVHIIHVQYKCLLASETKAIIDLNTLVRRFRDIIQIRVYLFIFMYISSQPQYFLYIFFWKYNENTFVYRWITQSDQHNETMRPFNMSGKIYAEPALGHAFYNDHHDNPLCSNRKLRTPQQRFLKIMTLFTKYFSKKNILICI